jgi:transposase-like protein
MVLSLYAKGLITAIAVSLDGERDILGLQCGIGGEGARFWMAVTAGNNNRGTAKKLLSRVGGGRRGRWRGCGFRVSA